jgi:AcrR family transcriptional regulator
MLMTDSELPGDVTPRSEKAARIVEVAARLFDIHGFHETSMDQIAAEARLAKPTLYYYFSGKDHILWAIHDELIETFITTHNERALTVSDPVELLEGIVHDLLEYCASKPGYVRVYLDHYRSLSSEYRAKATLRRLAYEGILEDILRKGMESGQFRALDAHITAVAIFGACRTFNWAHDWSRRETRPSASYVADAVNGLILGGLMSPVQSASRSARVKSTAPVRAR